jgi:hypothetical protein
LDSLRFLKKDRITVPLADKDVQAMLKYSGVEYKTVGKDDGRKNPHGPAAALRRIDDRTQDINAVELALELQETEIGVLYPSTGQVKAYAEIRNRTADNKKRNIQFILFREQLYPVDIKKEYKTWNVPNTPEFNGSYDLDNIPCIFLLRDVPPMGPRQVWSNVYIQAALERHEKVHVFFQTQDFRGQADWKYFDIEAKLETMETRSIDRKVRWLLSQVDELAKVTDTVEMPDWEGVEQLNVSEEAAKIKLEHYKSELEDLSVERMSSKKEHKVSVCNCMWYKTTFAGQELVVPVPSVHDEAYPPHSFHCNDFLDFDHMTFAQGSYKPAFTHWTKQSGFVCKMKDHSVSIYTLGHMVLDSNGWEEKRNMFRHTPQSPIYCHNQVQLVPLDDVVAENPMVFSRNGGYEAGVFYSCLAAREDVSHRTRQIDKAKEVGTSHQYDNIRWAIAGLQKNMPPEFQRAIHWECIVENTRMAIIQEVPLPVALPGPGAIRIAARQQRAADYDDLPEVVARLTVRLQEPQPLPIFFWRSVKGVLEVVMEGLKWIWEKLKKWFGRAPENPIEREEFPDNEQYNILLLLLDLIVNFKRIKKARLKALRRLLAKCWWWKAFLTKSRLIDHPNDWLLVILGLIVQSLFTIGMAFLEEFLKHISGIFTLVIMLIELVIRAYQFFTKEESEAEVDTFKTFAIRAFFRIAVHIALTFTPFLIAAPVHAAVNFIMEAWGNYGEWRHILESTTKQLCLDEYIDMQVLPPSTPEPDISDHQLAMMNMDKLDEDFVKRASAARMQFKIGGIRSSISEISLSRLKALNVKTVMNLSINDNYRPVFIVKGNNFDISQAFIVPPKTLANLLYAIDVRALAKPKLKVQDESFLKYKDLMIAFFKTNSISLRIYPMSYEELFEYIKRYPGWKRAAKERAIELLLSLREQNPETPLSGFMKDDEKLLNRLFKSMDFVEPSWHPNSHRPTIKPRLITNVPDNQSLALTRYIVPFSKNFTKFINNGFEPNELDTWNPKVYDNLAPIPVTFCLPYGFVPTDFKSWNAYSKMNPGIHIRWFCDDYSSWISDKNNTVADWCDVNLFDNSCGPDFQELFYLDLLPIIMEVMGLLEQALENTHGKIKFNVKIGPKDSISIKIFLFIARTLSGSCDTSIKGSIFHFGIFLLGLSKTWLYHPVTGEAYVEPVNRGDVKNDWANLSVYDQAEAWHRCLREAYSELGFSVTGPPRVVSVRQDEFLSCSHYFAAPYSHEIWTFPMSPSKLFMLRRDPQSMFPKVDNATARKMACYGLAIGCQAFRATPPGAALLDRYLDYSKDLGPLKKQEAVEWFVNSRPEMLIGRRTAIPTMSQNEYMRWCEQRTQVFNLVHEKELKSPTLEDLQEFLGLLTHVVPFETSLQSSSFYSWMILSHYA